MLSHVFDLSVVLQLELRLGAELLAQNARQPPLLALHPIGVMGDVGDRAEIELPEHALALAAILERRRTEALLDQRHRGPEPIEHIEGRRMEGRGARFLAQVGPGLEHRHRHAPAHQVGCGRQAHRPRARNQDPLIDRHAASERTKAG